MTKHSWTFLLKYFRNLIFGGYGIKFENINKKIDVFVCKLIKCYIDILFCNNLLIEKETFRTVKFSVCSLCRFVNLRLVWNCFFIHSEAFHFDDLFSECWKNEPSNVILKLVIMLAVRLTCGQLSFWCINSLISLYFYDFLMQSWPLFEFSQVYLSWN